MADALKHEQIMLALLPVLQGGFAGTVRNPALPELDANATIVTLRDGTPRQTDVFLNPPMYEFTVTPTVTVIVSGGADDAARDATVADVVADLVAAIEDISELGGLITDCRPQPPNYDPREFFGMPNVKAAQFGIELDFWSESSAG